MIRMELRMTTGAKDATSVIRALRSIMLPARIERGCLRCDLAMDVEFEDRLIYSEEWISEAELSKQIRSERFVQMLLLMETAKQPPTLQFEFVSETRGLDFVEAVKLQGEKDED